MTRAVEAFQSAPGGVAKDTLTARAQQGDEIQRLDRAFKAMSQRINQQINVLEANDQKRRNLVANVSHDLRTPLAAVLGYLETLQLRTDQISPAQHQGYIDIALRNAMRLSALIDELFELAKLEAGGVTPGNEPFSIADLVQDVVQQQGVLAQKKGIVLESGSVDGLPFVLGDISLIQRVLENLIANAIHHVQAGERITVKLVQQNNRIKVAVWDGGRQIDQAELEKLFDRYYQGSHRDERTPGAGLGLSIAKQILCLHNSVIEVCNEDSGGKVFSFSLQAAEILFQSLIAVFEGELRIFRPIRQIRLIKYSGNRPDSAHSWRKILMSISCLRTTDSN